MLVLARGRYKHHFEVIGVLSEGEDVNKWVDDWMTNVGHRYVEVKAVRCEVLDIPELKTLLLTKAELDYYNKPLPGKR